MFKSNGFSLIELMIVVALIGIFAAILGSVFSGSDFNTICKSGYLFSVDYNGNHQQMINEEGRAISCIK